MLPNSSHLEVAGWAGSRMSDPLRTIASTDARLEQVLPADPTSCQSMLARPWFNSPRPNMWPTQHWAWPAAPGTPLGAPGASSKTYPNIARPALGTNHYIPGLAT